VFLVVAMFAAGVGWLQRTAPAVEIIARGDLEAAVNQAEIISCERTLPAQDEIDAQSEALRGPVGRVSSVQVNLCPRRFDGRLVTYIGEVVGDVLRRDGGAWVQLNDDAYALGPGPLPGHRNFSGTNTGLAVWLPDEFAELATRPGRRDVRGDLLAVEGVLHRADPNDGGGLTIRAQSARLVATGFTVGHQVHREQARIAVVLALVAIAMIVRERSRAKEH
jgi:hypothetical protein